MPKIGFNYRRKDRERFCGLAIFNPKLQTNVGTLFRTAVCLGNVDWLACIGQPKYGEPKSDVVASPKNIPMFYYDDWTDFFKHIPRHCELVGIELHPKAKSLMDFEHPKRACYVLGGEEFGIPPNIIKSCRYKVEIPTNQVSLNVAAAGTIVLYDRMIKEHI